ncbi:hypothetical protein CP061683_2426A, partial [Chlamydia psittaci 06-1683]
MPGPW